MDEYKDLENKLNESNKQIDDILNSTVNIKYICIINDKILLHNNLLPSVNISKGLINENNIVRLINDMLNINIHSIDKLDFKYYNNYDERYYIINISNDDILSINSDYTFSNIDDISNKNEYETVYKLNKSNS